MAICDAKYRFLYFNIGAKGSASDGGVFSATPFYKKMVNNELNLPDDEPLPQREKNMPYVLVADKGLRIFDQNVQNDICIMRIELAI